MVGGLIGGLGGVIGGAIGTYFSIRNTGGPRERAFMIRVSVVAWLAITAFLAGLFLLPTPYKHCLWAPYVLALPLFIVWLNKRQAQIRSQERRNVAP